MDDFPEKAKRCAGFIVMLFAMSAAVFAQVDNPEELFDAAKNDLQEENYENAVRLLERCVELDEESADAHHELAHAYSGSLEYERALEAFTRAITLEPENERHHSCKGKLLLGLEQYDQAVEVLKKTVELAPEKAGPCHDLAHAYEGMEKYEDALEWFEKAIKLDSDSERHRKCHAKCKYAFKMWKEKKNASAGSGKKADKKEKAKEKEKNSAQKEKKPPVEKNESEGPSGLIPEIKDRLGKADRQLEQSPLLRLVIIIGAFLVIAGLTVFLVKLIQQSKNETVE